MNKVILCGNLGQNPEGRKTASGISATTFSIATTEKRRDGEHTEWHRIVAWDKLAESCVKYLAKGKKVLVEGKIQSRKWEDKDGITRFTTEIVASSVQFLSPVEQKNQLGHEEPAGGNDPFDGVPF